MTPKVKAFLKVTTQFLRSLSKPLATTEVPLNALRSYTSTWWLSKPKDVLTTSNITPRSVGTITTARRETVVALLDTTHRSFVHWLQRKGRVLTVMTASTLTIGSKISTIPKNTNLNTAPLTPTIFNIVSLEQSVPLHTKRMSYQFHCLKKWNATMTSTCSTSRPYGVPSAIRSTSATYAFMPTTGKTFVVSPTSMNTSKHNVLSGQLSVTLKLIRMDVVSNTDVTSVTAGKRLSTTLGTTRSENVRPSSKRVSDPTHFQQGMFPVPSITAPTTMGTMIDATYRTTPTINRILEIGANQQASPTYTLSSSCRLCSMTENGLVR